MQYGKIVGVNKPVSRLVLGTMIVDSREQERSNALLDAVVAHGGNTLDTANVYAGGNSERGIGQWMQARGNRDDLVILTKGSHPNADRQRVTPFDLTSDLYDSFARLKTDYIDIYLLHRDNMALPVGPIVEILNEHHAAGRIGAFGGSNWTYERLAEANDYAAKHGLGTLYRQQPQLWLGRTGAGSLGARLRIDQRRLPA